MSLTSIPRIPQSYLNKLLATQNAKKNARLASEVAGGLKEIKIIDRRPLFNRPPMPCKNIEFTPEQMITPERKKAPVSVTRNTETEAIIAQRQDGNSVQSRLNKIV